MASTGEQAWRPLEKTFAVIKPDAVRAGSTSAILKAAEDAGFVVVCSKETRLSPDRAGEFYAEHRGKHFFPGLVEFMSGGPIVALCLAKTDAIKDWRTLMGPTNTQAARESAPRSLRARFGTDGTQNATHGSDSPASAARELKFFFPNAILDPVPEGAAAREYIQAELTPVLVKGFAALCKEKPSAQRLEAIQWLADWLRENNPRRANAFAEEDLALDPADEDAGDFDGEEDDEDGDFLDDDEEAELDSQAGDDEDGPAKKKEKKPEEEEMMVELDVVDDDDDDDLGYDQDALNKMLAEVQARAAASKANAAAEAEAEVIEQVQRETADPIHVSDGQWQGDPADAPTAAKAGEEPKDRAAPVVDFNDEEAILREKAAQNLRDKREAAGPEDEEDEEEEEEEADSEDDLSEEETVEMTRKERLRQLKAAKAFFKADAKAADRAARGEVLEDEAELSDDGGHTDDEEEVEVEVGEGEDRVIRRVRAKRGDGLLDREELEEMVDYIDFNESKDDDERRAAKRAAAHARFEEERDDEELKKMHEALKNGFRRPNKNGELDDGPDYWQRRMRQKEDGDSDGDEFEIDIPDRAWEVVELSDDDDGAAQEWAEQAERRKKAASAREAAKKERESQRESQGLDSQDVDVDEDSQLMSAKDFGFLGSQDFKSMMAAGKSRRRRVGTGLAAAAMETQASAGSLPSHPSGSMPAPAPRHAKAPGLDRASSMSFLGKSGGGSRSNHGSNGLQRSFSLGGGASRSFVFGGGGTRSRCGTRIWRRTEPHPRPRCSPSSAAATTPTLAGRRKPPPSPRPSPSSAEEARACSGCCRRLRTGTIRRSPGPIRSRRRSRRLRTSRCAPQCPEGINAHEENREISLLNCLIELSWFDPSRGFSLPIRALPSLREFH